MCRWLKDFVADGKRVWVGEVREVAGALEVQQSQADSGKK